METIVILALVALAIWFIAAFRGQFEANLQKELQKQHLKGRKPADLSMLPARFIVFDLETTGLQPERHEIIEIAAIRVNRDSNEHDTFATLVQPRGRISARITELTGLDRKTLKAEGIEIHEALSEFRAFVGELPMVAYNAKFDVGFLHSECDRSALPRFGNRSDCALRAARSAWPGRTSYRLSAICKDAGVALDSEHRALADCQRAMLVYVAAVQRLGVCSIAR